MTEIEERNEKDEAALKQLITCAKAECSDCQLVPEPEEYRQCLQVIQTCRDILRESLGLPEEEDEEEEEIAGDDFLRAADEDTLSGEDDHERNDAMTSRSEVERKAHGTETE